MYHFPLYVSSYAKLSYGAVELSSICHVNHPYKTATFLYENFDRRQSIPQAR
jgi:hypothetical protein